MIAATLASATVSVPIVEQVRWYLQTVPQSFWLAAGACGLNGVLFIITNSRLNLVAAASAWLYVLPLLM